MEEQEPAIVVGKWLLFFFLHSCGQCLEGISIKLGTLSTSVLKLPCVLTDDVGLFESLSSYWLIL